MHIGIFFCVLWFVLIGSFATAQEETDKQVVCTVGGCREIALPRPRYSDASAFSVQQVWSVVDEILSVSGLLPNFQVVETVEVGNAAAVVIDGERYLAFNPEWIARYKSDPNARWQLYGVMAHEIGHHLQGHTITGTGSRPPTELEADEYAGFILAALGATLGEAQSLWDTLSIDGSVTHPPRHQRLAAVERGWIRRNGQVPQPSQPTEPSPELSSLPPSWALRNCIPTSVANRQAELCFSSFLPPQGSNTYVPSNASDGDSRTAWIEGVSGQGIGEHFSVIFFDPIQVRSFRIRNGYAKSEKTYFRNSRVRMLRATASNGAERLINLRDTPDWQDVGEVTAFGQVSWIIFEILDVYPGSRYQDTAITELRFN